MMLEDFFLTLRKSEELKIHRGPAINKCTSQMTAIEPCPTHRLQSRLPHHGTNSYHGRVVRIFLDPYVSRRPVIAIGKCKIVECTRWHEFQDGLLYWRPVDK